MHKQKFAFTIYGELPNLNEEIQKKGGPKHGIGYSKWKKKVEDNIVLYIKHQLPGVRISDQFAMVFKWHSKNRMKDQDNIEFGKKYIMDGAQKAGLISGDGWKQAGGNTLHLHFIDAANPRVECFFITNFKLTFEI